MSAYSDYIAKIAQEIDAEVRNSEPSDEIPAFPEPQIRFPADTSGMEVHVLDGVGNDLSHLNASVAHTQSLKNGEVLLVHELTSYYKCVRTIVIICKRVIRKMVRFVIEPIVMEINQNRMTTVAALDELQRHMMGNVDALNAAIGEINALKHENLMLQRRIDQLEDQVNEQQKPIKQLKKHRGGAA